MHRPPSSSITSNARKSVQDWWWGFWMRPGKVGRLAWQGHRKDSSTHTHTSTVHYSDAPTEGRMQARAGTPQRSHNSSCTTGPKAFYSETVTQDSSATAPLKTHTFTLSSSGKTPKGCTAAHHIFPVAHSEQPCGLRLKHGLVARTRAI